MNELVSICIPTWEMNGVGVEVLRHSLARVNLQTYKNVEVCITDHSKNHDIEKLCKEFSAFLRISYHRTETKRGSPSHNTNQSIIKATGDILKLLCMDDVLYDQYSIQHIVEAFQNPAVKWLASAYCHTTDFKTLYNKHIPSIREDIHIINTLGTPSAISIRKGFFVPFDEELVFSYDACFYKEMLTKFGAPFILDKITMINYLHPNQVTNTIANEQLRERELIYVKEKFA